MIVRRILLERFMNHERTVLDVPATGLIAITGPNGSGKSSLIEAVGHAVWGKSLRGKVGWRHVKNGSRAGIVLDDGTKITRKREHSRSHIEIVRGKQNDEGDVYDTATKAQIAVDMEWGSFDVWRRSCVFSSSDAAHFANATDGERKRLIETILGLERFDPALESCREELKASRIQITTFTERAAAAERMLDVEIERHDAARKRLAELTPPVALDLPTKPEREEPEPVDVTPRFDEEKAKQLQAQADAKAERISEIEGELEELTAMVADADKSIDVNTSRAKDARASLGRLGGQATCPTCRQGVTDQHRTKLKIAIDKFATELDTKSTALRETIDRTNAEIAKLRSELREACKEARELGDKFADARAQNRRHDETSASAKAAKTRADDRHKQAVKSWREEVKRIEKHNAEQVERHNITKISLESEAREATNRLAQIEDQHDEALTDLEEAKVDVAELEACEDALGLKGIRAQVLGHALEGIQAVANLWLDRICGAGLSLKLLPYSEKKTGGVTDSISLQITGAGAGEYLGASGGERRRLDVALLLALAEISRAAAGREPGTLFCDEVFDALDQDGQAEVADVLRELARDRAIIVITHSSDLARMLRPDLYLEAEGGVLGVA